MKQVKLVALCLVVAHGAYADFGKDDFRDESYGQDSHRSRYSMYWHYLSSSSRIKWECEKWKNNGALGRHFDERSAEGRCSRFFRALDELYEKEFTANSVGGSSHQPLDISKVPLDTYGPIGENGKTVSLGRFKLKTFGSVFESIDTDIVKAAVGVLHKRLSDNEKLSSIRNTALVQEEISDAWDAALLANSLRWNRLVDPGLVFDPSYKHYSCVSKCSDLEGQCEGPGSFKLVY